MSEDILKPDFRRFHRRLAERGIATARLYQKLGIKPRHYAEADVGIPMSTYLELMRLAAHEAGEPCLGVALAMQFGANDMGMLSYMVRNAPTFAKSLDLIEDYLGLVVPSGKAEVLKEGPSCIWTYDVGPFDPELARQDVEGTLVQFAQMIRTLIPGGVWEPEEVFFQHSRPHDTKLLEDHLTPHLKFDHHFNGIRFPGEFLHYAVNDADPALLNILERQVRSSVAQVQGRRDIVQRATLLISARLGKTDFTADDIARELGMTRRTLVRHLSERKTSFRQVRERVTLQMAKEILGDTNASITEAALQLGFSEPSAFHRSFKRQTGLSPSAYRKRERGI